MDDAGNLTPAHWKAAAGISGMSLRDFLLLVAICLVWSVNNIVSKLVVGMWHVPPLLYAAVRFAIVAAVTLPWLRPMPRPAWRILAVGLLMGGGSFALMFMGLQSVSPSAAAVVSQAGVPLTTLLSILILGERIHWRRALGITLTLIGVLVVTVIYNVFAWPFTSMIPVIGRDRLQLGPDGVGLLATTFIGWPSSYASPV